MNLTQEQLDKITETVNGYSVRFLHLMPKPDCNENQIIGQVKDSFGWTCHSWKTNGKYVAAGSGRDLKLPEPTAQYRDFTADDITGTEVFRKKGRKSIQTIEFWDDVNVGLAGENRDIPFIELIKHYEIKRNGQWEPAGVRV